MPPSSSISLQIPPAHSISELTLPSTLERLISNVSELEDSSNEDSCPIEVVENAHYATANANVARRFSLHTTHSWENSGSNMTSSGTGTGTGSFSQPALSTLASPNHFLSHTVPNRERKTSSRFFSSIAGLFCSGGNIGIGHPGSSKKWKTCTESNLRSVQHSAISNSKNKAHSLNHINPAPTPPCHNMTLILGLCHPLYPHLYPSLLPRSIARRLVAPRNQSIKYLPIPHPLIPRHLLLPS